ncbi:MAG: Lrp/AsnC family transcriptional regulator [Candidatus Diapherotrites archaeon]
MVSSRILENPPKAESFDLLDKKILYYVNKNCRFSSSSIAKALNTSREVVSFRIKRLIDRGVIVSFFPFMDMTRFGFDLYSVNLKFRNFTPEKEKFVNDFLVNNGGVSWVFRSAGNWDYLLLFFCKDLFQFHDFMYELKTSFSGFLKELDFQIILYEYLYSSFCKGFLEGAKVKEISPKKLDSSFEKILKNQRIEISPDRKVFDVDLLDLQIVEELSKDARKSFHEVSLAVKIPPETVRYRVLQLIKKEIIGGFWANLSFSKLGFNWHRVLVETKGIDKKADKKLKIFFKNHPFMIWSARALGKYDIIFDVNSKSDGHFSLILSDFFNEFKDILVDYESIQVLKEVKYTNFTKNYYSILE